MNKRKGQIKRSKIKMAVGELSLHSRNVVSFSSSTSVQGRLMGQVRWKMEHLNRLLRALVFVTDIYDQMNGNTKLFAVQIHLAATENKRFGDSVFVDVARRVIVIYLGPTNDPEIVIPQIVGKVSFDLGVSSSGV